jgi:hypothetical protein
MIIVIISSTGKNLLPLATADDITARIYCFIATKPLLGQKEKTFRSGPQIGIVRFGKRAISVRRQHLPSLCPSRDHLQDVHQQNPRPSGSFVIFSRVEVHQ